MIAAFLLKLVFGIALMWLLMPRKEVTDGFFRIQMLVVLGLSVLVALTIDTKTLSPDHLSTSAEHVTVSIRSIRGTLIFVAAAAYIGHVFWKLGRRRVGNGCIFLIATGSAIAMLVYSSQVHSRVLPLHQFFSDLSSAMVCGGMLTGMLLGHWYLTTPTMSIRPLGRFTGILLLAALMRVLVSSWSLISYGWTTPDSVHTLWFGMRLLGGILIPGVVAVMVTRILRYRNTQSATGVLFAGLVLVFMGEMTAALLERDLGIPW